MLVEAIAPGKNLGLEGIKGCRSILHYLASLGNRAAASRLTELEQMCTHLASVQTAAGPMLRASPTAPVDIALLAQPFSFSGEHRPSNITNTTSPNSQGQSSTSPSFRQPEAHDDAENDRRSADLVGADLGSIPLDDIDSLYWTYHPSGLSFTGVELADWETFEQDLFRGM